MTKQPMILTAKAVLYENPETEDAAQTPPSDIQLFPKPGEVTALDGRRFTFGNYENVIKDFKARKKHLPVDINHASEYGFDDRAYGWVTNLYIRDEALWAHIEWNDIGRGTILSKEYKYYSPAWMISSETDLPIRVTSIGLVNQPALDVQALARAHNTPDKPERNDDMDDKAALAAIKQATGLGSDTSNDALVKTVTARVERGNKSEDESLSVVPKADYVAVMARAENAENALKAEQAKQALAHAEALLDEATKAGKIAPASREFWLNACETQGIDTVKAHFDSLSQAEMTQAIKGKVDSPDDIALASADKTIATMLGIPPEDNAAKTA